MNARRRRPGRSGPIHSRRWTGWRLLLALLVVIIGGHTASAQTEVVEYYGQDALGSVRIVFNASGAAIARADYEPFGELFAVPNMPGTSGLPAKQFTGQERDPEASSDYFGARFYAPRTGRFSQIDPVYAGLFDPQRWNRYSYALNNPLRFVDPDGRIACFRLPGDKKQTCVADNAGVTAKLLPLPEVKPSSTTDPVAEGLADLNNTCLGDGTSRACGAGRGGAWGEAGVETIATLAKWFFGLLPPNVVASNEGAAALMQSPAFEDLMNNYKNAGCNDNQQYGTGFGIGDVPSAGFNVTAQAVGNFVGTFESLPNGDVAVEVNNTWGTESLTRNPGVSPKNPSVQDVVTGERPMSWPLKSLINDNVMPFGMMKNVTVTYRMVIPSPCAK